MRSFRARRAASRLFSHPKKWANHLIFHNMSCGITAPVESSHDRLPEPFRMLALPMLDRDGVAAPLRRLRPEDEKSTANCASAAIA
jgi:hypothetical protein